MDNARPFDLQEMEPKDKHLFEYNLDALVQNDRDYICKIGLCPNSCKIWNLSTQ